MAKLIKYENLSIYRVGRYQCPCGLTFLAIARDVETKKVETCGHKNTTTTSRPNTLIEKRFGVSLPDQSPVRD